MIYQVLMIPHQIWNVPLKFQLKIGNLKFKNHKV